MNFEEKVRAMSAKKIIMAMINGLKNKHVEIDMETFGDIYGNVCYGCAATNAICEISRHKFIGKEVLYRNRNVTVCCDIIFLDNFESSIDFLRQGDLRSYNSYGFARIKNPNNIDLPKLMTGSYLENLHFYEQLANDQQ